MTYSRVGRGMLRDNKRIDEKRRRVVLRIIQGSNKYGLNIGWMTVKMKRRRGRNSRKR